MFEWNVICTNNEGSYRCDCKTGFKEKNNGDVGCVGGFRIVELLSKPLPAISSYNKFEMLNRS